MVTDLLKTVILYNITGYIFNLYLKFRKEGDISLNL